MTCLDKWIGVARESPHLDFVNAGGDGYTMFADGQGTTREVLADVLASYIEGLGTITPVIEGRIVDVKP